MKAAAEGPLKGILFYAEDPDRVERRDWRSPQLDLRRRLHRRSLGGKMAKVVSWYDNEWGYSARTVDLVAKIGSL